MAKIGFFGEYIYLCEDIKEHKVKRKSFVILVGMLVFVLLSVTGCNKYEQITVTSAEIESVQMSGMKAVDVTMQVMISNPAGKVVVSSAEGTVKHFGKVIGTVSLAPMVLMPRRLAEYQVQAHLELASGLKIMEVLTLADPKKIEEMVVDLAFSGKAAGIKVKKNINDVPLKKLLEEYNNEKISGIRLEHHNRSQGVFALSFR